LNYSGVKIQKELEAKNEDLPEHRRMEFRNGVNLGDVIEGIARTKTIEWHFRL